MIQQSLFRSILLAALSISLALTPLTLRAEGLGPGIWLPTERARILRAPNLHLQELPCDEVIAAGAPYSSALRVDDQGQAFLYDPFLRDEFQPPLGDFLRAQN